MLAAPEIAPIIKLSNQKILLYVIFGQLYLAKLSLTIKSLEDFLLFISKTNLDSSQLAQCVQSKTKLLGVLSLRLEKNKKVNQNSHYIFGNVKCVLWL